MTTTNAPRLEWWYNKAANNIVKVGPLSVEGVAIAAGSATIAISKPDGTSALSAKAMTRSGAYFTYALDTSSTSNYPLEEGFPVHVLYTDALSAVTPFDFLGDCVRTKFPCMVVTDDILAYMPDASSRYPGTQSTFATQILKAFEEVKAAILSKGSRPSLIFDPQAFNPAITFRTLAILAMGAWKKDRDDSWQQDFETWMDLYRESLAMALESVSLRYDADESGTLSSGETVRQRNPRLRL